MIVIQPPPVSPMFLIGLDLGQSNDYTGLVVLEQKHRDDGKFVYDCRAIERLPLGTSYPAVVDYTRSVVDRLNDTHTTPKIKLVMDYTGVGRPVADLLSRAWLACTVARITITGGDQVIKGEHGMSLEYRVPKRDLASAVQVLLQSERLRIAASLPLAKTLTDELAGFRVKIAANGHDSYAAGDIWRSAPHDDLVLALALAAWWGETRQNQFDIL